MENAAQFKDMTGMVKIGKKRTQPEPTNQPAVKMTIIEPEMTKKQKIDEAEQ